MNWLKKHVDAVIVIGSVVGAAIWMSTQIHGVENRLNEKIVVSERRLDEKINGLDKRLIAIEAVMMTQGYNIKGIAVNKNEGKNEQ